MGIIKSEQSNHSSESRMLTDFMTSGYPSQCTETPCASAAPPQVDASDLLSSMEMQPMTLSFRHGDVEGEYLAVVACSRWPVLVSLFCFDIVCHFLRVAARCGEIYWKSDLDGGPTCWHTTWKILPSLSSLAVLYTFIGFLNARSRKLGCAAARQEELLLSACMSMVICNLLGSLKPGTAQDYVYVAYFLICTSTFLKVRWWVGTTILIAPILATNLWDQGRQLAILPRDAVVHLVIAWAVGGLMAYLVEWYRRKTFASQRMAVGAHAKELMEARERIKAQRQLAAAQAQAAQRALSVAREKAANEAKSEFMSLMCHEVRTPLNGCLASAEMLLETPLLDEQRELAKTIRVSGSILLSTVSNFLDFFKMEAGKALDIVRTEVDLNELVGDLHMIIEAMLGKAGEVTLHPPKVYCTPCRVLCDTDRVRGILLNLYSNAAKFTKQGHIALKVHEVGMDYVPQPPEGYAQVISTPAYQPMQSMDIDEASLQDLLQSGSTVNESTVAPAAAGPPTAVQWLGLFHSSAGIWDPTLDPNLDPDFAEGRNDTKGKTSRPSRLSFSPNVMSHFSCGTMKSESGTGEKYSTEKGGSTSMPISPLSGLTGADIATDDFMGGGATDRWLLFEVQDTGVGISSEGLSTLFQEFVQGTDDEMRKPRTKGGTGLGLSICSKQVGVLGGRIGAMSCHNKGSVFWFVIPLIKPLGSSRQCSANMYSSGLVGGGFADRLIPGSETYLSKPISSAGSSIKLLEAFLLSDEARGPELDSYPKSPSFSLSATPSVQTSTPDVAQKSALFRSEELQRANIGQLAGQSAANNNNMDVIMVSLNPLKVPLHFGTGPPLQSTSENQQMSQLQAQLQLLSQQNQKTPQQQQQQQQQRMESKPSASSSAPSDSLSGACRNSLDMAQLRGMRALLVEDNLINQTVARKMLTSLDMQCTVASNGLEAVKIIERIIEARAQLQRDVATCEGLVGGPAPPGEGDADPDPQAPSEAHQANPGQAMSEAAGANLASVAPKPAETRAQAPPAAASTPCTQMFDLILMDMLMPIMGGLDSTRAIRQLGCDVPILAMTANASDKDRDQCRSAGMDGFLSKPVLKDRLAGSILEVTASNRRRKKAEQ